MAAPIISHDLILAEFDRIKANAYEFSDAEICILVAANTLADVEDVRRVVAAGARGYCSKASSHATLGVALNVVLAGRRASA